MSDAQRTVIHARCMGYDCILAVIGSIRSLSSYTYIGVRRFDVRPTQPCAHYYHAKDKEKKPVPIAMCGLRTRPSENQLLTLWSKLSDQWLVTGYDRTYTCDYHWLYWPTCVLDVVRVEVNWTRHLRLLVLVQRTCATMQQTWTAFK